MSLSAFGIMRQLTGRQRVTSQIVSCKRFKSSKQICGEGWGKGVSTALQEFEDHEVPFFRDPDRIRRMLGKLSQDKNFTRDGYNPQRTVPPRTLGDFTTPHPGSYPNIPREYDDKLAEEDWANSVGAEDEMDQLEYKYVIPNFETENFTFDREHGILQEAEDERRFYEKVVLPKTHAHAFRQLAPEVSEGADSGFTTSKDPKEWAFVERLMPIKSVIKTDFEYKEYPSGFVPPNKATRDAESGLEYWVGRSRNCMLPVYVKHLPEADMVYTQVDKCEGNMYLLRDDLQQFLVDRYEQEFPSQVAELYGRIKFLGDFEQEFKEFLLNKGF